MTGKVNHDACALAADRFVVCVLSVVKSFYPFSHIRLQLMFKAAFVVLVILVCIIYYTLRFITY